MPSPNIRRPHPGAATANAPPFSVPSGQPLVGVLARPPPHEEAHQLVHIIGGAPAFSSPPPLAPGAAPRSACACSTTAGASQPGDASHQAAKRIRGNLAAFPAFRVRVAHAPCYDLGVPIASSAPGASARVSRRGRRWSAFQRYAWISGLPTGETWTNRQNGSLPD